MAADTAFADLLAERLDGAAAVDGVRVVGWRFDLSSGWTLRAGLKDGELAGPYEPPVAAAGTRGRVYLRWSDGACWWGDLDPRTADDFPASLAEWRGNAYHDPDAPDILPPAELPSVRTADPAVSRLVDREPGPLLAWLERVRRQVAGAGLDRPSGDAGAARGWRFVYSSRGLRVVYEETSASFSATANQLYARAFGKRRLPTQAELDELLADVAESGAILSRSANAPVGRVPVLLAPALAMSLVGTYLGANLAGVRVAVGRSAYTLDDFRVGRRVLREDLSLSIDTLLDLEGAASPISAEGVPGGRAVLVEAGRLKRPIVDLKYAARTGFPPTPVPGGSPGLLLRGARPPRQLDETRAALPAALQVHTVLGLRTQDPASGRYSLVAPYAQVIRGGQLVGRAKVSLVGSFFDDLLDPRTELIAFPWGLNPGLLVWMAVERQA